MRALCAVHGAASRASLPGLQHAAARGRAAALATAAANLMNRLNDIPFESIGKSVDQTLAGVNALVNNKQLAESLAALRATLAAHGLACISGWYSGRLAGRSADDEIREVAPGLFLGPAMWKSGNEKTLVLFFALDARLS